MFRFSRVFLVMAFSIGSAFAQQAQPAPIITFSSTVVHSIVMTGNATWTSGSDQESGSATLTGYSTGQSSIELQLSGGTRGETQNAFTDADRTCTWTGTDGVTHNVALHNCWLSTVWFLPQITMQPGVAAPDDVSSSAPASNGKTVIVHHERHPVAVRDTKTAAMLANVSKVDLGVDASSHLPQWLLFQLHPDNDAGVNLQVEVDFSDYRTVNGITVPFHIQKFINHTLVLDLQIASVQVQ
jgi:hypothetical protein